MKFRKKPVVIEAECLTHIGGDGCSGCEAEQWIGRHMQQARCDGLNLYITTLEGTMRADRGDWVIRGVKGEFYPCKPDIFAATYDTVDES